MPQISKEQIEQSIKSLVDVLMQSKGWLREYADAIIRDAIDRKHLLEGEPVEEFKFPNQMWQWKALKDGAVIYQYGEHVPALFKKSAKLLPTSPAAFIPITAGMVTDEMIDALARQCPTYNTVEIDRQTIAASVNIYLGAKK
jgi:hypothetical protein